MRNGGTKEPCSITKIVTSAGSEPSGFSIRLPGVWTDPLDGQSVARRCRACCCRRRQTVSRSQDQEIAGIPCNESRRRSRVVAGISNKRFCVGQRRAADGSLEPQQQAQELLPPKVHRWSGVAVDVSRCACAITTSSPRSKLVETVAGVAQVNCWPKPTDTFDRVIVSATKHAISIVNRQRVGNSTTPLHTAYICASR